MILDDLSEDIERFKRALRGLEKGKNVGAYIPVLGFAPDLDPAIPGVLTDCDGLLPSLKGMKAIPSGADIGGSDLSATAQGAAQLIKPDASLRTFAGTTSAIYELVASAWTDRSRAGNYSVSANRWRFAQFGKFSLASADTDLQESSSGAFIDISGAPKSEIVETVRDFVMLFNTDDSASVTVSHGSSPDRWWCCAQGNHRSWTPSIATQCATDRLLYSPGPIIGGKRLGNGIIAYKETSMYLGTYIGAPLVWDWQLVPGEIGAFSHESIVSIDTAHYFVGLEDFWFYDGTRPVPIGGNLVRQFFFDDLDHDFRNLVSGSYDRSNHVVIWFYPSTTAVGNIDSYIAYNYRSGRWGRGKLSVQAVLTYAESGTIYNDLGALYATYNDIPTNIIYDTAFVVRFVPNPAYIDTAFRMKTLTGVSGATNLTTGDYGVDGRFSVVQRVRPRFATIPADATQEFRYRNQAGALDRTAASVQIVNGAFDHILEARWHRFRQEYSGDMELIGFDIELLPGSFE